MQFSGSMGVWLVESKNIPWGAIHTVSADSRKEKMGMVAGTPAPGQLERI
jgi:hypothetical protein